MKTGWSLKPLGEVCTLQRGFDLPTQDRRQGTFPLVSSSGVIDTHDAGPVSGPGVVTGRSGSIGNVFYIEEKFWPLNTTLYVRDFFGNDPRFVYYLLTGFDLKRFSGGTGVPTLNRNDVHSELVLVPSDVSEQRRIVAILDEAFEAIATAKANAEKNLRNARELFDCQLQTAFSTLDASWPRRTFDSLAAETLIGLTRSTREQGDDLRCRYVKMNNISANNRFDPARLISVDVTDAEIKKYRLRSGDFLFNTRNSHELVGKSCVFDFGNEDDVLFNNNIMRVRFQAEIDPQFILYAFSYRETLDQLESMKSGTTNVAAIYYRDLATLEVPTPDAATQRRISQVLSTIRDECDRLTEIQRHKLAALDELKKSMLHRAFSGQL